MVFFFPYECKQSKHVDIVLFAMLELQWMPNSFEIYVVSFCRNKFQRYNGYLTLVNNRIIYSTCQVPIQYVYLCIEPPFQTYFIQGITTDLFHGKRTFYSDKNGSIPWKLYCWNVFRISLNYNGIWNIFVNAALKKIIWKLLSK